MLQALLERQVVPDLIVGSSVGSLNGAFIAADPCLGRVDAMIDTWTSISDRGLLTESFLSRPGRLVRGGTYLHSNDSLRALIEGSLGSRTSRICPFTSNASRPGLSGHRVTGSSGNTGAESPMRPW